MRVLRFVGPGESPDHVTVETVEGDEQFSLHISDELRAAANNEPAEGPTTTTTSGATLSPREIQVRARAGESAESIAASADMSVDRVLRFAGPVIAERQRITVEARRARARQSTPEGQLVEFGESVDARYAAHGIDPAMVDWDACRRHDGVWMVTANWQDAGARRSARWALSLQHRIVTPLDETAADLLSERAIRPVVHAVPDPPASDGQPDMTTDALPGPDDLFDQDRDASDSDGDGSGYETPPLPLRLAEPLTKRLNSGHPKVPGWDDILLGVRRNSDS